MLLRHANGLPMNGMKIPVYDPEENPWAHIDPRKLDLAELEDLRAQARADYMLQLDKVKTQRSEALKSFQERKKAEQAQKNPPPAEPGTNNP